MITDRRILLLDEMAGPIGPSQRKYLRVAYDSNERELSVISDLLRTAQMDATEYTLHQEPHDIVRLIDRALSELEPTFELWQQDVLLTKPDEAFAVLIDVTEMKLVIVRVSDVWFKFCSQKKPR